MKPNLAIISGASKGLGLGVSKALLGDNSPVGGEYTVINLSRSGSPFNHENLIDFATDLSDTAALEQALPDILQPFEDESLGTVVLVNNAATINPVAGIGGIGTAELEQAVALNFIAPVILTRYLVNKLHNFERLKIINVSSGAANACIDGWSVYSATKAALNRFTENMASEFGENASISFMIYNPGIMDTSMQSLIRESDFKDRARFIEFKQSGQLRSPETVARHLVDLIAKNTTDIYESF